MKLTSDQLVMSGLITYSFTMTFVRISILLLYRRIFATPAFRKTTVVVGGTCIAWFIAEAFTDIFQCHPFTAAFHPQDFPPNQCFNLPAYYWGITASNLGLDVIILYMPLHMVWGLKLPVRQKLMLSGIFLIGSK